MTAPVVSGSSGGAACFIASADGVRQPRGQTAAVPIVGRRETEAPGVWTDERGQVQVVLFDPKLAEIDPEVQLARTNEPDRWRTVPRSHPDMHSHVIVSGSRTIDATDAVIVHAVPTASFEIRVCEPNCAEPRIAWGSPDPISVQPGRVTTVEVERLESRSPSIPPGPS